MGVGTGTMTDTAALLESILKDIDGLRVYPYVADTFRPPGVVIGLPEIDWNDPTSGFCAATYDHPLVLVVSRNSDRDAQAALAKWVAEIAAAINAAATPTGSSVELLDAAPRSHNVNGQDMPGYTIRVRVRA